MPEPTPENIAPWLDLLKTWKEPASLVVLAILAWKVGAIARVTATLLIAATQFATQLRDLSDDVEALKKNGRAIARRVSRLESRAAPGGKVEPK